MEKIGLVAVFDVKEFNRGVNDYINGVDKANDATERGEKNSFSFARALEVAVGGALVEVAKLAANAAMAMVDFGKQSIDVAADFESQLAILSTAAAGTGKSIDELGDIAITVGADSRILGASASGAAEAMTGLFKAGLTNTEVFGDLNSFMEEGAELGGALAASFNLAAATNLDVAQSSDLAAIALATFGGELETEEERAQFITDALDNFVKAADASVAEVEGLAEALKFVGPTAAQMGMSIEDTNNALALLSTAGIQGSMAGTTLGAVLGDLTKGTDKSTEALEELGIKMYNQDGTFKSLVDIVGQFEVAMADMTEEQKTNYLTSIFTRQGLRGINVLLDKGVEGWNGMADATEAATGIEAQAEARSKTFASQMEALQGQIETLQIQFGSVILQGLTPFVEMVVSLAEKYGPSLSQWFENVVGKIIPFIEYFANAVATGDLMNDFLIGLPEPLQNIIKAFSSLTQGNFAEGIAGIGNVVESVFGKAMKDTFIEVAVFLRGILPDLIAGFSGLAKGNFAQGILSIGNVIRDIFGEEAQQKFVKFAIWFKQDLPDAITKAKAVFITITKVFGAVVRSITSVLGPAIEGIKEAFGGASKDGKTFEATFQFIGETLKIVGKAIGAIAILISGVLAGALNGIARVIEGVTELWEENVENILGIFEGFAEKDLKKVLKNFGKLLFDAFKTPFKLIWKLVSGFVEGVFKFFLNLKKELVGNSIIPDMMDAIQDVIENILDIISTFINRWISNIIGFFKGLKDDVIQLWDLLWSSVQKTVNDAVSKVKEFVNDMIDKIESAWSTFVGNLEKAWSTLWSNIKTAIETKISEIKSAITTWIENIKTAWSGLITNIETTWNTLWQNITEGIATKFESIKTAIGTAISGIVEKIETYFETFKQKGKDIIDKIVSGITEKASDLISAIKSAIDDMVSSLSEKWEAVKNIGKTIVAKIKEGLEAVWESDIVQSIRDGISSIKDKLTQAWLNVLTIGATIVEKIKKGVDSTWESIKTLGQDIIGGIIGGIESKIQSLKDSLWNTIQEVIDYVKGLLGIDSPAKALMPMGVSISEGVAVGIEDGAREIQYSMADAVNVQPMQNIVSEIQPMATQNINNSRQLNVEVNPTYTNVQSEAGIYYDVLAAIQAVGV